MGSFQLFDHFGDEGTLLLDLAGEVRHFPIPMTSEIGYLFVGQSFYHLTTP
jgi:hypothetical protein